MLVHLVLHSFLLKLAMVFLLVLHHFGRTDETLVEVVDSGCGAAIVLGLVVVELCIVDRRWAVGLPPDVVDEKLERNVVQVCYSFWG
ncbi:hypothetical protein V8F33_013651 [Rhypophila sp. PSN 637]